jgi:hypothetical protein
MIDEIDLIRRLIVERDRLDGVVQDNALVPRDAVVLNVVLHLPVRDEDESLELVVSTILQVFRGGIARQVLKLQELDLGLVDVAYARDVDLKMIEKPRVEPFL